MEHPPWVEETRTGVIVEKTLYQQEQCWQVTLTENRDEYLFPGPPIAESPQVGDVVELQRVLGETMDGALFDRDYYVASETLSPEQIHKLPDSQVRFLFYQVVAVGPRKGQRWLAWMREHDCVPTFSAQEVKKFLGRAGPQARALMMRLLGQVKTEPPSSTQPTSTQPNLSPDA